MARVSSPDACHRMRKNERREKSKRKENGKGGNDGVAGVANAGSTRVDAERRGTAARRCKFYRPDKSELVENARKDALLYIYIPT